MTDEEAFVAALTAYDATLNPADSCPCSNCHRDALRAVWDLAVTHERELQARDITYCPSCGHKVTHGYLRPDEHPHTWACINPDCARHVAIHGGES